MNTPQSRSTVSTTYELTFFDLIGNVDSIQQYRTEAEAREAMSLYNEPDSTNIYSRITLAKTEWYPEAKQVIMRTLSFQ